MFDAIRFSISATNATGTAFSAVAAELSGVRGALAGVADQARRTGGAMRQIGQGLSMRVTAPIVAGLGAVVMSAGSFEQSMNRVSALTGAVGDDFDALGQMARDLGSSTKFSASEAADAMGFLGMAGFKADQILGAMPSTLQLAAAANADLATSADIVSNILSGFGREVSELAEVNDVLVATLSSSNTDIRQLGDAMKYVGPVASSAGMRFNEIAAAIGLLGNAGIQGEMGGTALRGMLTRLLDPTAEVADTLARLGVTVTDSGGKLKSLTEIVAALEPHADDTAAIMQIFGQRAGPAMSALLSQGSAALAAFEGNLDQAGGTAARIASVQMQGFNGALTSLKSAMEGLAIAVADSGLLAFMTGLAERATGLVRSLSETNPEILKMGVIAAGAAAAIGPLLIAGGLMVTALAPIAGIVAAIISPLGLLAVGAAAAATALYMNWDSVAERFPAIAATVEGAIGGILTVFDRVVRAFRAGAASLGPALMQGVEAVDRLLSGDLTGALSALAEYQAGIFETMRAVFNSLVDVDAVREGLIAAWDAIRAEIATWPAAMMELGGDIMDGLKQGLMDKLDSVRSSISGIGSGIIEGLKERLGIQSPSRVMKAIGHDIMAGLGIGIEDGRGSVVAQMEGVGDAVEKAAARAASAKREFTGLFSGIIDGSKSAAEAVGDLLRQAGARHLEKAAGSIFDGLFGGFGGAIGSLFGFADGAAFGGGRVVPFATGGVVSGPTLFPMATGQTGLMGEAGPEAIMPLTRIGGSLGVRAQLPRQQEGAAGVIRLEIASADAVSVKDVQVIAGNVALQVMNVGLRRYDDSLPARQQSIEARGV